MENKHTIGDLRQMQSLPLQAKIQMTRQRIRGWIDEFGEDGVYVSFSGGKDSTVLLDIVRKDYPDIEAVFVNTGLEYPSVRQFVLSKENVTELKPTMNFRDVIIKYGYPIIGKEVSQVVQEARIGLKRGDGSYQFRIDRILGKGHYAPLEDGTKSQFDVSTYKFLLDAPFNISDRCCKVMKKNPARSYERKTKRKIILATMADESRLRRQRWLKYGCNAWDDKKQQSSNPMSFWTEQDVLTYIHTYIHTTLLLQTHTVKWCVIGIKTDLQRGRLIFTKDYQKLTQAVNCRITHTRLRDANAQAVSSADLVSHKINSGL